MVAAMAFRSSSAKACGRRSSMPHTIPPVVEAQQVRRQRGLRRLVFHVATEMRADQAPPQLLLGGGEEMLVEIVGALRDGEHLTVDARAPRDARTGCR